MAENVMVADFILSKSKTFLLKSTQALPNPLCHEMLLQCSFFRLKEFLKGYFFEMPKIWVKRR